MGRLVVVQFITLDGVVEDPDGRDGTAFGGWIMRDGPEAIAGDQFRIGPLLDAGGILLLGRASWEHFSALWPHRDDPFSRQLNAAEKAVVTHRPVDAGRWENSEAVPGDPAAWVRDTLAERDVVVMGSGTIVAQLAAEGLVDEYRLITFPTAAGAGRRLFPGGARLRQETVEPVRAGILSVYSAREEA